MRRSSLLLRAWVVYIGISSLCVLANTNIPFDIRQNFLQNSPVHRVQSLRCDYCVVSFSRPDSNFTLDNALVRISALLCRPFTLNVVSSPFCTCSRMKWCLTSKCLDRSWCSRLRVIWRVALLSIAIVMFGTSNLYFRNPFVLPDVAEAFVQHRMYRGQLPQFSVITQR